MKKALKPVLVFLVVLTLLLPSAAFAQTDSHFTDIGGDYGDTHEEAYVLDINHSSISGNLTVHDVDFFKLVPNDTLTYTFETTGSTNTHGHLDDEDMGEPLVQNNDSGAGSNFKIKYTLLAGRTYYIVVSGQNYDSTHGNYTLKYTHAAPERGNTPGNLIHGNDGFACLKGDYIYYANSDKGSRLYKIKTNGTGKTKLSNDPCSNINVVGNYVYYTNTADGNKIYRVRKNGTGRQLFIDTGVLNFVARGDWIWYVNLSDGLIGRQRISLNGVEPPYGITDWGMDFLNVYNNNLYFMDPVAGNSICRTSLLGGDVNAINHEQSFHIIADDNKLFYEGLDADGKVYKRNLSGSGRTRINKDTTNGFNYSGGWIYFVNADHGDKLYKIKTDGTGLKKADQFRLPGHLHRGQLGLLLQYGRSKILPCT